MSIIRTQVERAIRHHGSQAKLAEAIGCSQQQISYLLKAKSITAEMAKALDDSTDGQVSRHMLRPDIFGPAQATPQTTAEATT